MPTFGPTVAAAAWPVLRAIGGLTPAIFTTVTHGPPDYETGQIPRTTTEDTVDAKVSPFLPDEVDGLSVTVADKKVLVLQADLTSRPTLLTTITLDGVPWALQAPPESVSNDGLWRFHVRRIGDV
jgi:hypothetical protein